MLDMSMSKDQMQQSSTLLMSGCQGQLPMRRQIRSGWCELINMSDMLGVAPNRLIASFMAAHGEILRSIQ